MNGARPDLERELEELLAFDLPEQVRETLRRGFQRWRIVALEQRWPRVKA